MALQIWKPTQFNEKFGVAIYNFSSSTQYGLSLRIGETVQIAEETTDWYKGWLIKDQSRKGIFPKNCIALKESTLSNPGPYELVRPITEPIVEEVTRVLEEWGKIWKEFFLERKFTMFTMLRKAMHLLIESRREIICGKLTKDQQQEVKTNITNQIDLVNSKLGLDLIPRIEGEVIDSDSTSVTELYFLHVKSAEIIIEMQSSQMSMSSRNLPKLSTAKRISHSGPGTLATHMFITFKSLMCNISDAASLMFGLYDPTTNSYISEIFMVKLTKFGMPTNIESLGKQYAVFSDLKSTDLQKDVYLVCKIYREGKLIADSKKTATAIYRRPFGVGAFDVSSILNGEYEDEKEFNIQIFSCNEADFFMVEDCIIKKQTAKYSSFGSNPYGVCIGLKKLFGDVEKIASEKVGCILVPRLGFPEVILPGYVRNDFFVTLFKAEFDKGSKSSGKNIEVAMCVVSDKGQVFNDCMYIGCESEPVSEYHSFVLYHANVPHWNETVKITLPSEQFHTAHLRFTFSHCSRNEGKMKGERMFGFSFIKLLQEDNTVIPDASYGLFIYKLDNSINFVQVRSYLRLPSTQAELSRQEEKGAVFAGPHRNPKENLTIKTCLCSTKLTQNSNIQYLLRWRRIKNEEIKEALDALVNVSPDEIVKFLQDVFDALFKILSEKPADFSLPVFKALVSITKIVEERKFESFKSTLTTYIECHFSATLAYRSLADCLCQVVKQYTDPNMKPAFVNAMQSLRYIFKIIVRSYQLHITANVKSAEVTSDLKEIFRKIFETINEFMAHNKEDENDSKIDILRNIPELCNDVLVAFTESEFSQNIKQMITGSPKILSSNHQRRKLQCLQSIVASRLFVHKDSRAHLLPAILQYLGSLMEKKHELSSCLELLGEIITLLKHRHQEEVFGHISMLVTSMLGAVLNVLLTIERKGHLTALTVSCLFGILKLMNEQHFQLYVDTFENKSDLRDFLKKLTVAFKELLTMEIYPKDWFLLKTVGNNVMLSTIQYFSKFYIDYFLQNDNFQLQLWVSYFQLGVLFLKQPSLFLESFSSSKREKMLSRYGDMRLIMAFEIVDMWDLLDDKKRYFIPNLIGPFLEMTLVPEQELRKTTIPVFYDMMKVEFSQSSSFKKVESEFIEKLELFLNQNKGDPDYQQMFHDIMTDKFNSCGNPEFQAEGLRSITSITELLQRLLDYRATKDEEINACQKMMCTVRLLEFYKDLGRLDMYIRNIHKLVKLHLLCSNYTEAGFTLLLHASLLEWSDKELPAFLNYPNQSEGQRKEQIYLEIIEYLDKGKMWESGIRLCKELASQYENRLVDYVKLSEILRRQAYFYDCIMQQMRPAPTYFRVSFFGRGFPHYLKDQVLIFRGMELETLAGFTARINLEFPSAEIMSKNTPPDASIVLGIGQHIQICNVSPIPGEIQMFENNLINEKISSYYKSNEVEEFVFSRPFHKGEKDRSNEFKTLWLERTIHWTKRKFPGILKWSTIESVKKMELTPLENAIESILSKNRELAEIIEAYQADSSLNVNRLSMVLNGVIDANVNGGIANYQDAFLSNEYLFFHPEHEQTVQQLKVFLNDQTKIVEEGLEIHESFVSDSLKPFHDKMLMMFSAMKTSLETGQPMESILGRPNSLQLNSSVNSVDMPRPSPKGSPSGNRVLSKSPSVMIDFKKEKTVKKTTSLQNMFRRVSSAVDTNTEPINVSVENISKKSGLPPLPVRKIAVVNSVGEDFLSELPCDAIPLPALKRLGLKGGESMVGSASAPSLNYIEEEECPSLPPKRHSMMRETSSDGSVSRYSFVQQSSSNNSLNQQFSACEFNGEVSINYTDRSLISPVSSEDSCEIARSIGEPLSEKLISNTDEDVFVNNDTLGSLYEEIKNELQLKGGGSRYYSSQSDEQIYNKVRVTPAIDKPVLPFRTKNAQSNSNEEYSKEILNTPPLPAKLSKTRSNDGLTFI